ncbi:MAG TPA: phenylacetic acid degradation operon negative regulatory protein PaaX [Casimicrobiaceae bacterium]|nr:phenylacetic acid degradation operon negative regulatory protein PaaX [Casimicrobiaceae bacterium]
MTKANSVSGSTASGGPRPQGARAAAERWIRTELRAAPPKARSLIVTVWGDSIAPHGGAVWLSGLIRLMAPFGINERLVRTSVYRLVQEGWLAARQDGRRSLYRLTSQGARRFEHAYRRIYAAPSDGWDGEWEIVVAPSAALRAADRAALRKELWWEGFGAVAPGLLVRPARSTSTGVGEIIASLGLARDVWMLRARDLDGEPGRLLSGIAGECWDLDAVSREYRAFIRRFERALHALGQGRAVDPEQCFVVRTLLIHAFRRATLRDPQLPRELLPSAWPGRAAYALCRDFYRLTQARAERHLAATLEGEHGRLPSAAEYFYARFGGLR